jgi:hypothetical protein
MFGGVKRHQIDMMLKDQARLLAGCIDPRLIGDQTDALPPKQIKIIARQHIDSEVHGTGIERSNKEQEADRENA